MSKYSFSFDASQKFTQDNNIKGYLNHFARELNDKKINHSNKSINDDLTHNNMTLVRDAETGKMIPCQSHEQILDAFNNRLADAINLDSNTYKTTGKKVRKDAVQAFGLIMQIDPDWYADNKDNPKALNKSYSDMLNIAKQQFNSDNIISISAHLDESNPHLHLLMTPISTDNRLSQRDFINSPKLKMLHKNMRQDLRNKGYDIDMNRKTPLNAKRLSEQDYKALKQEQERVNQLQDREQDLNRQSDDLIKREADLDAAKQGLEKDTAALSAKQEYYANKEAEIDRLEHDTTIKHDNLMKLLEIAKSGFEAVLQQYLKSRGLQADFKNFFMDNANVDSYGNVDYQPQRQPQKDDRQFSL